MQALFNSKMKYAINPLPNTSSAELTRRCAIPGFKPGRDPFNMEFGIGAGGQRVAVVIKPFGAEEAEGAVVGGLELRDDGVETMAFSDDFFHLGGVLVDDIHDRPALLAAMIRGCEKAEREYGEFDENYAKELFRSRENPIPESEWKHYRRQYASFIYNGKRAESIRKWIEVLELELDKARADAA